ncbi:23S rRNA (pseudouridine(1915)-N(3))-methyltransferase RlmH [Ferruginibacter albus]|uniref:23S rRNA (pseudouridine(1915)-N(3))-methyltransferase RlmH n=1 Tax=Ferruginibacter albus TaxID=2875540 RepID=UPI001CC39489|nr:23S rRNA (pseudouridine(1915)-N(3))-methyltransferase RlmH [Ferruginibacter albus]UAY53175.1 23S rRNA (pseudouridine(1915)-N(3))-methyltransferase RlmH [Ferruginibacter albus]
MKIELWTIGKMHDFYVKEGIDLFTKRITGYYPAEWKIIAPPKNAGTLSETDLKKKEAEIILSALKKEDYLVLLDERGKQLSSEELATFIQTRGNESVRTIVFLIGGAFGVSKEIAGRANYTWSLSRLVFPHQLVRLLLSEQIYRACSILRNEKYHHS